MDKPTYARVDGATLSPSTRRRFLQGGALLIAFAAMGRRKAWAAGEEPSLRMLGAGDADKDGAAFQGFAPGGFIRIGRDNSITLIVPSVEMGQGIYTGEAMLIAEELEVGLDQVQVVPAPPNEELYQQPLLKSQSTGGSTSIRGAWVPLRQAGAAARQMLIGAAAAQWGVDPAECAAQRAIITHRPTGRTATYGEVVDGASRLPVPKDPPLKDPRDFKLIGRSVRRVETPSKVNGTAVFGIDVQVPGMKVATVTACPVFGGKVASVDDRAARAVPGVRDVVRIDNAVAVVGDHFWAARKGLEALDITWDYGPNAGTSSNGIWADLKARSETGQPVQARRDGDVDGAMKAASKRVEAVYQLPFLAHATMEPINTTVHVRPDACEIWVGTQVPTAAQGLAAKEAGLPVEKVILHNHLLGGGFGRRLEADSIGQAVAIAKQVDYPVKIIWTREEDIRRDIFRPAYYDRIAAGLGPDGLPTVWTDRVTGGSVMGHYFPGGLEQGKLDDDAVEGAKETPYRFPAVQVDWVRADPPVPITWWRGVGPTHNVFVVESFMDELAHAAGKDPVDYRRALLQHNPRSLAVLNLAVEKAGWGNPLPGGSGRGVSLHDSFGSHVAVVIEAAVDPAGLIGLKRIVAAIDCGLAINPDSVKAQLEGGILFGLSAALYSGITFAGGRVEQSNFHDYRNLRINETPPIEVHVVQSAEGPGGVGETGTVSAAPALGNAIFAATGKRLRSLPFRREELRSQGSGRDVLSKGPAGREPADNDLTRLARTGE
ncbi:xanthine dehydrogenase family protein molybdopterin-binding subunit [Azospirillum sp. TSO35-2]|uniref:xanthine dehydrogenase family protein molybdopterin-binding subunit n=1 Tax=Azospirillum sp. TSO35-2 TaxID=716796 RepID=UPI000D60E540|nr:xanthine dehydrogenase family protein molybdopterin-binding subunit [Azospirillum sp. TSO35-2]PWC34312.1 aldehyde dehydrogenase [Azospirillum sp. TSO35-2]